MCFANIMHQWNTQCDAQMWCTNAINNRAATTTLPHRAGELWPPVRGVQTHHTEGREFRPFYLFIELTVALTSNIKQLLHISILTLIWSWLYIPQWGNSNTKYIQVVLLWHGVSHLCVNLICSSIHVSWFLLYSFLKLFRNLINYFYYCKLK